MQNHEDVHAAFNRYQCSLCEKRFKLRKSCLAHIRVHHNDSSASSSQVSDRVRVWARHFRATNATLASWRASITRHPMSLLVFCSICPITLLFWSKRQPSRTHEKDNVVCIMVVSSQQVATSTSTGEASANGVVVDNDVDDGQEGDGDDHNQTAVQSLLDVASGEEYVVTLEEGVDDVEAVLHLASQQQQHHHHHPHQNQQVRHAPFRCRRHLLTKCGFFVWHRKSSSSRKRSNWWCPRPTSSAKSTIRDVFKFSSLGGEIHVRDRSNVGRFSWRNFHRRSLRNDHSDLLKENPGRLASFR